jgi:oligopeptide/dipeptide ABC transporter ATP-binding protein
VTPLLDVRGLTHDFPPRALRGGAAARPYRALHDVSFTVARGETLALVGESASGKSTVARCVLHLLRPTAGTVRFDGTDLATLAPSALRHMRRRLQIVFQDPLAALDPRLTAFDSIAEGLRIHRLAEGQALRARVTGLLDEVGLPAAVAESRPHELSTGQRQRVCIARALAVDPELMVLDEPVSALDVGAREHVLALLAALQRDRQLSYLFISHDLSVVAHIAARVAVLYAGRLMEVAPARDFFAAPRHPYSALLLDAIPSVDPAARHAWTDVDVQADDPRGAPGCPFDGRCRHPLRDAQCRAMVPPLAPADAPHQWACNKAGGHR